MTMLAANADDPRPHAQKGFADAVAFGVSAGRHGGGRDESLGIDGMAGVDLAAKRFVRVPPLAAATRNVLAGIAVGRWFDIPLDAMADRAASLSPRTAAT
jgi:hypothetical protein